MGDWGDISRRRLHFGDRSFTICRTSITEFIHLRYEFKVARRAIVSWASIFNVKDDVSFSRVVFERDVACLWSSGLTASKTVSRFLLDENLRRTQAEALMNYFLESALIFLTSRFCFLTTIAMRMKTSQRKSIRFLRLSLLLPLSWLLLLRALLWRGVSRLLQAWLLARRLRPHTCNRIFCISRRQCSLFSLSGIRTEDRSEVSWVLTTLWCNVS